MKMGNAMKSIEPVTATGTDCNPVSCHREDTCQTDQLLESLMVPGEMGVIGAETGNYKTAFGLNLVAHALRQGKQALWVNADMQFQKVIDRLRRMPGQTHPFRNFRYTDFSMYDMTSQELVHAIRAARLEGSAPSDFIFFDGSERVSHKYSTQKGIDDLTTGLSEIANEFHIPVWTTSQVRREAVEQEIIDVSDLAYTMGGAHRAGTVVNIGTRVLNKLLTLCVVKSRNENQRHGNVYRLKTDAYPRLDILPTENYRLKPCRGLNDSEIICVGGGPNDLPFDVDYSDNDDTMPDNEVFSADISQQPLLKPFHGTKGFIPIGRKISESPFYQNHDWEKIGLLTDLYAMAQFRPGDRYAPKTTIPVHLERGEVMVSLELLSKRWGISKSRVRGFLDRARKDSLISIVKVMADGRRIQVIGSVNDGKTTSGTTSRSICQVIKCLDYADKLEGEAE